MPLRLARAGLFASLVACPSAQEPPAAASLVVSGARIWTGNPQAPWAEALAVRGNRIIAVASRDEVARHIVSNTDIIEAQGSMLVPGFIDTHLHFLHGGTSLASVQLRDATGSMP